MGLFCERQVYNFTFSLFLLFSFCSLSYAEQKTIEIVTEADWYDATRFKEKKGSLVTQISTLVLQRMGYQVKVSFAPWARALLNAKTGEADGVAGIFITQERAKLLAFTDSLITTDQFLFKRRNSDINFTGSLSELTPYKIGVVRNYTYGENFDKANYLDKVYSVKPSSNLRMLLGDRVDVIIETADAVNFLMRDQFQERIDEVVLLKPAIAKQNLYFAFSKKLENHKSMTEQFNRALAELRKDGTISTLRRNYTSQDTLE